MRRSKRKEAWADDTCSLRLSDENVKFKKMYGKLAAILTDKLQKGSVVDSVQAPSPEMAYPVSYGQRLPSPRAKLRVTSGTLPRSLPLILDDQAARRSLTTRVSAAKLRAIGLQTANLKVD
jgi:hypothetical protein